MYIPVRPNAGNAAKLVAAVLLWQPDMRDTAPLFCSELNIPFTHCRMDRMLRAWIQATGLDSNSAKLFSCHSARVYLACALLAQGRSPSTIQAMLRWQSADSLRVYACLNASAYAAHLDAAAEADISSVRAAHLPLLDSYNMALQLQSHMAAPAEV